MNQLLTTDEIVRRTAEILKEKLILPKLDKGNPCGSTDKCRSCGSHEYIRASGSTICSYCRVPKDGFTVRDRSVGGSGVGEMAMSRFNILWGAGLIRPDVVVRIKDMEK